MGDPFVSIITPVLNRVDTMGACLASIARQTYHRSSTSLSMGGSTDGTLHLLREYLAPYAFHWVSEPDNGTYEAINKGIAISRGEVLAYLNSDDLYLPLSVDVAVRAIDDDGRGSTHAPEMGTSQDQRDLEGASTGIALCREGAIPTQMAALRAAAPRSGVDVRLRDLRVLAPARWRGDASLFGHARSLHDLLDVRA